MLSLAIPTASTCSSTNFSIQMQDEIRINFLDTLCVIIYSHSQFFKEIKVDFYLGNVKSHFFCSPSET